MIVDEEPTRYAIRLHPRALRDIDAEMVRIAELAGEPSALDWLDLLQVAISTLATFPRRFSTAPEALLFASEVRQMLFRRTPKGAAWRVFFTVEEHTPDGRIVRIRHVRHAASPLTDQDAGELLTN